MDPRLMFPMQYKERCTVYRKCSLLILILMQIWNEETIPALNNRPLKKSVTELMNWSTGELSYNLLEILGGPHESLSTYACLLRAPIMIGRKFLWYGLWSSYWSGWRSCDPFQPEQSWLVHPKMPEAPPMLFASWSSLKTYQRLQMENKAMKYERKICPRRKCVATLEKMSRSTTR